MAHRVQKAGNSLMGVPKTPQRANNTSKAFERSAQLFGTSRSFLAGGVSSSMRAATKPLPLFFSSGKASHLFDVDGNEFVDYSLAWGPLILGHSHPSIVSAVTEQLHKCHLLGAQNELEIEVAKTLCNLVPCADRVVFNNTGTEAVQVAFRLARAWTGRHKIIRFEGHYHGWLDNVLIGYRPPVREGDGRPVWPTQGINRNVIDETVVLQWNNLEQLEKELKYHDDLIAAIITEPILCNCNCLMPDRDYLHALRELATRHEVVLIFDEVITGFRVSLGGAQELFGVTPDLAIFGKAVAGGFPFSVVAGKDEIMRQIAEQKVMHAGTFNGNPVSLAAAKTTLDELAKDNGAALARVRNTGSALMNGIAEAADDAGIPLLLNGVGSVFNVAFTPRQKMRNYRDTLDCNLSARDTFIEAMLQAGIYLMPDGRWYVSAVHSEQDVQCTLDAVRRIFETHARELKTPSASATRDTSSKAH